MLSFEKRNAAAFTTANPKATQRKGKERRRGDGEEMRVKENEGKRR